MRTCLLVFFSILFSAGYINAQSLSHEDFVGYDDVERYYKGCISIAKAEQAFGDERNFYFEDAISWLSPVLVDGEYQNRYRSLALVRVNVADVVDIEEHIQYTYEYARSKYDDIDFRENMLLREDKPVYAKCRVKTLAIKPRGRVVYKDIMMGMSIVIALCEPTGEIRLTAIAEGVTHPGISYENNMVSFCKWESPEEEEVLYQIDNLSDKLVSLVLIAN